MAIIDPSDKSWDDKLVIQTVPDGDHVVFISDAFPDTSKNKGTPMVEISFQVHDPADKAKGKVLKYQRFWTSEKAMPQLVRLLRACGATKPFDTTDKAAVENALVDRMLRITVKTRTEIYNGQSKKKTEAGFFAPLTPADRARLTEAYGETMLPPLAEDGPADGANGLGMDGPPPVGDDDIPF